MEHHGWDSDGQVGLRRTARGSEAAWLKHSPANSLHNYRWFLLGHGFAERRRGSDDKPRLSLLGHSIAGACAGWTKCVRAIQIPTLRLALIPHAPTQRGRSSPCRDDQVQASTTARIVRRSAPFLLSPCATRTPLRPARLERAAHARTTGILKRCNRACLCGARDIHVSARCCEADSARAGARWYVARIWGDVDI